MVVSDSLDHNEPIKPLVGASHDSVSALLACLSRVAHCGTDGS